MIIKDKIINLEESDLIVVIGEPNSGKTEAVMELVERERAKYVDLKAIDIEEAIKKVESFTDSNKIDLAESAVIIDHVKIVPDEFHEGQTESEILRLLDACMEYKIILVTDEMKDFIAYSVDEVVNI